MNALDRIFLTTITVFLMMTQCGLSQIPFQCLNPTTLKLNATNTNIGPGKQDCFCDETSAYSGYCQLVNIELTDDDLNDYSCFGVLLNAFNPYGNDIKLYSSLTCQEYISIYEDLPNRYFIDVADATPGSSIQVVICKDDQSDIIINADTTPSGLCESNECEIYIECPDKVQLKPKDGCLHYIDDYRDQITILDECEILYTNYVVEQVPPPRSLIERDTTVNLYLYDQSGNNRILLDECSVKLSLESDTISPTLQLDTTVQKILDCQYDLPEIGAISYNQSEPVEVITSVDDYEVDLCNGFSTTYRWRVTDECGNASEFVQKFEVLANLSPPQFTSKAGEIKIQALSNCKYVGKIPVLEALDNCGDPVEVIAKLYDDSFNYMGLVSKEIEITESKAYIIYEAEDGCGNINNDTLSVASDQVIAPELECVAELNYVLSPLSSCGVTADWSLPAVVDNCAGVSVKQIEGPKPGDLLTYGNYVVSYEAKDNSGNSSVCSFSINVTEESVEDFVCLDINYSVDHSCNYDLLVDAVFQYNNLACTNLYSVNLYNQEGIRIPAEDFKNYIGTTIDYELCYTRDNYCCSAKVKIEDKLVPILECQDVILSCLDEEANIYPILTNECREVTWEESVLSENSTCDNDSITKVITKQYIAIDIAGNRSTPCIQEILIKRLDINEAQSQGHLIGPRDTTISCEYISDYQSELLTLPGPLYKGEEISSKTSNSNCEIYTYYEDQILLNIDCNLKILRRWTINEPNCATSNNSISFVQFISFSDTIAPKLTIEAKNYTLKTDANSCNTHFTLPPFSISDNCSSESEIKLKINDEEKVHAGDQVEVNYGVNKIIFLLEDKCGNVGRDTIDVFVEDRSSPVAICLDKTSISLSDGAGWLSAEYFNEGSFDDCSDSLTYEVRKMESVCTDSETEFSDKVSFCCEEIGREVQVVFRVTDQEGNTNECMALVRVEQKINPEIICLPQLTITCDFAHLLDDSLSRELSFGSIVSSEGYREPFSIPNEAIIAHSEELLDGYIKGSCSENFQFVETIIDNRSECGTGEYVRRIVINNNQGEYISSCDQTINIVSTEQQIDSSIIWPESAITIIGCDANIDSIAGAPKTKNESCSLLGLSFEDQKFEPSDSAEAERVCFKILRNWEAIDWCNTSSDGKIIIREFEQIIKVLVDSSARERNIEGVVVDQQGLPISNVEVTTDMPGGQMVFTDTDGSFSINGAFGATALLNLNLNDNPVDEISALDVFVLQKYLLDNSTLDGSLSLVAADVNMDNQIDPQDLRELTRLIIGIDESFGHNKSWRFVSSREKINTSDDLQYLDENFEVQLNNTDAVENFVGIKIGDLFNANYKKVSSRSKSYELDINYEELLLGQWIDLNIDQFKKDDLLGIEMSYNDDILEVSWEGESIIKKEEDGLVHLIGFVDSDKMSSPVLSIRLKLVDELNYDLSQNVEIKLYNRGLQQVDIDLNVVRNEIELRQNNPNPFRFETDVLIHSFSTIDMKAALGVTDMHGKQILERSVILSPGDNTFTLNRDLLPGPGIYLYYIRTNGQHHYSRMVLIDNK